MKKRTKKNNGFQFSRTTINWESPAEYMAVFRSDPGNLDCRTCPALRNCDSGSCKGWCRALVPGKKVCISMDDGLAPGWCPRKR